MIYQSRLYYYELLALLLAPVGYTIVRLAGEFMPMLINRFWPADFNQLLQTLLKFIFMIPRLLMIKVRNSLLTLESFFQELVVKFFRACQFVMALIKKFIPSRIIIPAAWGSLLDRKPKLGVVLAACLGLFPISMSFFSGHAPLPDVHDEFCNLLTADTFSHGRLANPPHPLWQHFETFHVIQQPSYASKFPPAQGAFLAVGKVLTGKPIAGVWLSFVLMAAAICWALEAFFSTRWALLGTALCVVQTGILGQPYTTGTFGYWDQSYFGGAVSALGGALLFGSLKRLRDRPSASLSLTLGLSLAILANTRPYEGFLASVPAAYVFFSWIISEKRFTPKVKLYRVLLPLLAFLSLAGSWMAYYNWRVTGNPFKLPFEHHDEIYAVIPKFGWQYSRPMPVYRHPFMKQFHLEWDDNEYKGDNPFNVARKRVQKWFAYYWNFPMLLAIAGLGVIINTFWMRFFSLEILIAIAGLVITSRRELPHHTAPIITAIYAMTIAGFQRIYQWHWKSLSLGRVVILAVLCTYLSLGCLVVPMSRWLYDPTKTHYPEFRKNILSVLHNEGGRHLIIVKYKDNVSGDDTLFNWVYNDADIDASSVVWAMDMGPEKNRELLDYFKSRKVWLLRGNTDVPFLVPYGRARFMESSSAK